MSSSETDHPDSEATIEERQPRSSKRALWAVAAIVVILAIAAIVYFVTRDSEPEGPPAPILDARIEEPVSGAVIATNWSSPSGVAVDGERIFVLDTGNNRILDMDREGVVDNIICETDDCALLLDAPMDLDYRDGLFYVANTEVGRVDVVDARGTLTQSFELPVEPGVAPRATGVFVAADGAVWVSDGTSGKIAMFSPDGRFLQYFGEDTVGVFEFTDPTGLTMDGDGNLYVAEFSLGLVRKISPIGRELTVYSMMGGVTTASEAADVVIDPNGLLYLADFKRSAVHVFSPAAQYYGIIGLVDGSRADSPLALLRPSGLAAQGDEIYVIDAERGLQIYIIDPTYFSFE